VNRVSQLKKGQVRTTKIDEAYGKIGEVITLLTPLAKSQPPTLEETVLKEPVSQVEVQKAGSRAAIPATVAKPKTAAAVSMLSILKSNEFRQAYHQALNLADNSPEAQKATARKVIEGYFSLEEIAPNTPLNSDSVYFTEEPIEVAGTYKFLVPGTIKRELIAGTLFLLSPKAASVARLAPVVKCDGSIIPLCTQE
jgi:ATP-dependent DNA ligase